MYGIEGYQPIAATTVDEVLTAHGDRLHALVGRRLRSATGLCYIGDGGWCFTLPAFFDFDGSRLEVDAVLGAEVRRVNVLESEFRLDTPDGRSLRRPILSGLELIFDGGRALQFWNLIGELHLTARATDSSTWERHPVPPSG